MGCLSSYNSDIIGPFQADVADCYTFLNTSHVDPESYHFPTANPVPASPPQSQPSTPLPTRVIIFLVVFLGVPTVLLGLAAVCGYYIRNGW
jgi:hypothetical protein